MSRFFLVHTIKRSITLLTGALVVLVLSASGILFYLYPYTQPINLPAPIVRPTPIAVPKEAHATTDSFYAPVLMYHHVSATFRKSEYNVTPVVFEQQMAWLHDNGYHVISYAQFYHALTTSTVLPEKPIVLTFDDNNKDQYENAFPILKKYGYTAIFFVPTGYVGKRGGVMTWAMLKDLVANNMEIGSHSVTHPNLTVIPKRQLDSELTESKKALEEHLSIHVDFFAYPGGDKSNAVVDAVKKAGYLSAVTTIAQVIHPYKENPYRVTRILIDNDMKSFVNSIGGKNLH